MSIVSTTRHEIFRAEQVDAEEGRIARAGSGLVQPAQKRICVALRKVAQNESARIVDQTMRDPTAVKPTGLNPEGSPAALAGISGQRTGRLLVAGLGSVRVYSLVPQA